MLWIAAQLPEHVRRCIELGSDVALGDIEVAKGTAIASSIQLCHRFLIRLLSLVYGLLFGGRLMLIVNKLQLTRARLLS